MPGFTTHYLFGVDAYKKIKSRSIRKNLYFNHSAYALGLQGPDVFFYYLPSYLLHKENLGALAHSTDTGAFFAYLLESRKQFIGNPRNLAVADAYITGFMGHYTLDCAVHPYVYAFTSYDPATPQKNTEYFGQHAYFETDLDCELLAYKKGLAPSAFHQNATITLTRRQRKVISQMLCYAYNYTYPGIGATKSQISSATHWMRVGTRAVNDPTGQKKVLVRFIESLALDRPFISAMLPSDRYQFVADPMNLEHKKWIHPWTGQSSNESFINLYKKALELYTLRIEQFYKLIKSRNSSNNEEREFLNAYGNRSFLSGLPLR